VDNLILVESPNKVRDVQAYAKLAGIEATVEATAGHLVDLPPMKDGPAIDLQNLVPERLVARDGAENRIARLKKAIAAATRVIVATDADREGEAIAAQLWPWIPRGKAWRTAFEEITPAGVSRGLAQLRPTLDTHRAEAALCRRVVDRLAGWHATDTVFAKLPSLRGGSAGRLQSAALRLVVERSRAYSTFKATTTWGVRAHLRTQDGHELVAVVVDEDGAPHNFALKSAAEAVGLLGPIAISSLTTQRRSQSPRPPFEATSWLQVAQRALGLSVKEATAATQALFEGGVTTYPRTDTVRVAVEAISWARAEIQRRFGESYLPPEPWDHKDRKAGQGAHEAIRPTIPHGHEDLEKRTRLPQHQDAYSLIEARFLASQAAARVVDQTRVMLVDAHGVRLEARGHREIFDGWKKILTSDAVEESLDPASAPSRTTASHEVPTGPLPPLHDNDLLEVLHLEVFPRTTKPKPLFTQAALVAELRRLGIGRPSTYQSIVPLLLSRAWVNEESRKGAGRAGGRHIKVLVPTDLGETLSDFLAESFPSLVDYAFTAELEGQLDAIESGTAVRADVIRPWWAKFELELNQAGARPAQHSERKDLGPCPRCASESRQGRLRLLKGTSSKTNKPYEFAGCDTDTKDTRTCGYTAPTQDGALQSALACPACGKPMRPVRRKDGGHSWHCAQHEWFLASRDWQLVKSPLCPECDTPMVHREKTLAKGEHFWACFAHKAFHDSDVFGRVVKKRRKQPPPKLPTRRSTLRP
jgi:DNA topoisomerase-1